MPDAFLLFSSHASINRISMEISRYNQPTPIQSIPEPVVIDFHLMDSRVYMTGSQVLGVFGSFGLLITAFSETV